MNSNKESYNLICGQWDEYRKNKTVNECIIYFARLLKYGAEILDIGCGTGYPIGTYLAGMGFSVTGIDVSDKMIEKAKALQLANASFETADIMDYQTSKSFDAVIAFDSLWHIEYSRQKEVFPIIGKLLNKGSYFLFTYGKRDCEVIGRMFGQDFYYSSLDISDTKRLLIDSGFNIIDFWEDYKEITTGQRELLAIAKRV